MHTRLILILLMLFVVGGCRSTKGNRAMSPLKFRIDKVTDLSVGGISLLNRSSLKDFKMQEGLWLAAQAKRGQMPVDISFSLEVRNPNGRIANLEEFQLFIALEGTELLNLDVAANRDIAADGISTFTVNTTFDLLKAAKDTGYDTLLKMILGLVNKEKQPLSIDLYLRPSVKLGKKRLKYPGFIKLTPDFQSGLMK